MKKTLFITIAAVFTAILLSCGSAAGQDPAKIAEQYAKAYYTWNLAECEKLMGPFYEDSPIEMAQELFTDYAHDNIKKIMGGYKFTVKYNSGASEIDGDDARIVLDTTIDIDKDAKGQGWVELEKVNGKWYVSSDKLWMHDGAQKQMQKAIMDM